MSMLPRSFHSGPRAFAETQSPLDGSSVTEPTEVACAHARSNTFLLAQLGAHGADRFGSGLGCWGFRAPMQEPCE